MIKEYFSLVFVYISYVLIAQIDTIKLSEVEINANRVKNKFKDQMRIVQIITKEELEHMPANNLTEILDYVGNVDVRQRGVHNIQSDLSIRGGNYEQVLIMLDGVPINDPQTGHHNMNIPIDIQQIEQIEILSGGDARQYGVNAFSGVINIVTKKPEKQMLHGRILFGDHKYISGNINGAFELFNLFNQISLGHHLCDGYRINTDFTHTQISWKMKLDGKKNITEALFAAENKAFGAMAFYTPKFPYQFENTKTLLSTLTNKLYFNENTLTTQIYYRQNHDRFELFRQDMSELDIPQWYKNHNYHMTRVTGLQSNIAIQSLLGKTTVGADLRHEQIFSNILGVPIYDTLPAPFEKNGFFTKKANKIFESIYIDHHVILDKFQWSAGAMTTLINHKNLFFLPGVEVGYQIFSFCKIFTALNQSFRLPTYTELYYKDPVHEGNSTLKPEKANQIEAGLKLRIGEFFGQFAYFYRKGKNIIDWVKKNETDKWKTENITQVNVFGFESNITYMPVSNVKSLPVKIQLSYAYNSITKLTGQYYSKYVLDVLRHKVVLTVINKINKNIFLSWALLYHERTGTYTEFTTGLEKKYKPYLTFDAKISYKFKALNFFIQGSNIFNTHYYDFANIPMPGRWIKAGINFELN